MPKHSTNSPEYNNAGNSGSVKIYLISSEKLTHENGVIKQVKINFV